MKEELKDILLELQNTPCRLREIDDNEKQTFNNYTHLQRYFSALDLFPKPESTSLQSLELPSRYHIHSWNSVSEDFDKIWKTKRYDTLTQQTSTCNTFVKSVHLLNPIDVIKNRYICPEHPLIPQNDNLSWKTTLEKIHSNNNQAYVDAVANFVLSRFRELNLTPHCVMFYGASTGISKKYSYNISNEYDTYRQCKWFWRGIQSHNATIVVNPPDDISEISDFDFDEFKNDIITCPFDLEEKSVIDLDDIPNVEGISVNDCDELESVHSYEFNENEKSEEKSETFSKSPRAESESNLQKTDLESETFIVRRNSPKKTETDSESEETVQKESDESESGTESETESDESIDLGIDILLEMDNMPVILIYQEAQEGTMDDLLEEEVIDNELRGTQGWESRWIAWIFQVVATLSFLQSTLSFTHNDLHTNNIVWRETDKKFLFYKTATGQIFRVPTYGKIFSIIDFGRSIFRLGKNLWISDDHWPNNDAGEQYNFGPFYDKDKPKVKPNESFDLCRLSVSLIDGLFDEDPPKKKGKAVQVMSKEDDWIVYETNSPLYNLLWSWTVDDEGKTIYQDASGEEKYPGFDLYVAIAHNVHSAVPREQLNKPIFERYRWKNKVPKDETIYSI